jgi:RNA polymerase sigma-70 factor (ECF subfamily)
MSETNTVWGVAGRSEAGVTAIPFFGSDEALVEALRRQHPGAAKALFDRYVDVVDRVLIRLVGISPDADVPDLIHEVFTHALDSVAGLQDPDKLRLWITRITVSIARRHLRKRAGPWRLVGLPIGRVTRGLDAEPDLGHRDPTQNPRTQLNMAMAATYAILARFPIEQRMVFALRVIDGQSLVEISEACGVSLGTAKSRLRRAEARFVRAAREHATLRGWLGRATQWSLPIHG